MPLLPCSYDQLVKSLSVQQGKTEAQLREPVRNLLMTLVHVSGVQENAQGGAH